MWYTDFFDTVRMSYDNQNKNINSLIAEQIMKLAIIGGKQIVLSQTQAFDLDIIRNNMNNTIFKKLLLDRKIVFKSYNHKATVLDAFIDSLQKRGDKTHSFFKYSSFQDFNEGSISDLNLKRDLALQYLNNNNPQGVDTNIQKYCDSIQNVSAHLQRTDEGGVTQSNLQYFIQNPRTPLADNLYQYLSILATTNDRSMLYERVDNLDIDENDKLVLKSYIDFCYNRAVGLSLTKDITITGHSELNAIEGATISIGPFNIYEDKIINTSKITWDILNNEFYANTSQKELIRKLAKYIIQDPSTYLGNIGFILMESGVNYALSLIGSVPPSIFGISTFILGSLPYAVTGVRRQYEYFKLKKCFKILK